MRKTYVTKMPDKAGAFLLASQIISKEGGNIVRVNYNKAVDVHTLFIEVAADEAQHKIIAEKLTECGYLTASDGNMQLLMIVLTLPDVPGAVTPVLDVIHRYSVNITYLNSQENGTPYQHFRMALLIENTAEVKALIEEISKICEIKILYHEVTDRTLDGAVFYVTFANELREALSLSQEQTNEVLIHANKLMQNAEQDNLPVNDIFDDVRRFANIIAESKWEEFGATISVKDLNGAKLYAVKPPCGSNFYVIETAAGLAVVGGALNCYRAEMKNLFQKLFSDFDTKKKIALLPDSDIDQVALLGEFDSVYMSKKSKDNFVAESNGQPNFRESDATLEPLCALGKIISGYLPPVIKGMISVGDKTDTETFSNIGSVDFGGHEFKFFEGLGGHVKGECAIVCDELKLVFTGDIYFNKEGINDEQKADMKASDLLSGVDFDRPLNKLSRNYLLEKYAGYTVCPGWGEIKNN